MATIGTAELLFRSAEQMGLDPTWITPNNMFAISVGGQERYVNFARSPLNSHANASLARDKYFTRRILERHQLPNIPFIAPKSHDDAALFLAKYGKIIAKPVRGSGARDIHIVTSNAQLETLHIKQYILEQYITGQEWRFLILNEQVIGVHRSEYGTSVAADRALQRISYPITVWDPSLVALAIKVTQVLGLQFAAVDYLIDDAGQAYVLEVNTAPGLKWFHAPTTGPIVDVASQFLKAAFTPTEHTTLTLEAVS